MPILSIIMFFLLVYIVVRKNTTLGRYTDLFVVSCTLKIYWFQGYFFKIGSSEISSVANISSYFLLLYSIYLVLIKRIKFEKRTVTATIFFVFIICLGMIYEKIFPYDGLLLPEQNEQISWDGYIAGTCSMYHYVPSFSAFLRPLCEVLVFSFEVLVFKQVCNFSWIVNPYMKVIGYLKYGIYYGYLEFFIKNIVGNLNVTFDFAAVFVGVNEQSVYTEAEIRDGIFYTLQGLTREPSHFNCFLFNVAILMLLGNVMKRIARGRGMDVVSTYSNLTLYACIGLMLLTGGFSSVWFLAIIGCCALLLRIRENGDSLFKFIFQDKLVMLSFFISFVVIFTAITQNDYLYNRLSDAIDVVGFLSESNGLSVVGIFAGNDGIGATIARFVSVFEGLYVFINRPLLGVSWCVQPVHDFTVTLLSNMGLLGVFSLCKMLTAQKEKVRYDFSMIFFLFIIAGLPITMSPGGLCMYWVLIFEATRFYANDYVDINGFDKNRI